MGNGRLAGGSEPQIFDAPTHQPKSLRFMKPRNPALKRRACSLDISRVYADEPP